MAKRGQRQIVSSVRPEEVVLLDDLADLLEERARRVRRRTGTLQATTTWAGGLPKISRASVIRAAARYALEHQDEFISWVEEGKDCV